MPSGMFFTVGQNGKLYGMNQLIDRLFLATGNGIERGAARCIAIGEIELAVQVLFGNVVDERDGVKSHPGTNGVDVPCFGIAILLLKVPHRLNGVDRTKGDIAQNKQQQKAYNTDFCAFAHNTILLPFLLKRGKKGSIKMFLILL